VPNPTYRTPWAVAKRIWCQFDVQPYTNNVSHHTLSIIRFDPRKSHRMILSLSRSPDAPQGLCMASHGHVGRVQRGPPSHKAPRHQWTPSRLPTASPTTASARRQPGPPQHTQGAHARHNRGRHTPPRAPSLDRRRVFHIPSRAAPTSHVAAARCSRYCGFAGATWPAPLSRLTVGSSTN
jgi:hypothetical protein